MPRVGLLVLLMAVGLGASQGSYGAVKRSTITRAIEEIAATPAQGELEVWTNDNGSDASAVIKVGEELRYHVLSSQEFYYLLILVNSKGYVSVLSSGAKKADSSRVGLSYSYPRDIAKKMYQRKPTGKTTVYALGLAAPVSITDLGGDQRRLWVELGNKPETIRAFVSRLNTQIGQGESRLAKVDYLVDIDDLQYEARAIKRTFKQDRQSKNSSSPTSSKVLPVQGIRFDLNSANLTSAGRAQLNEFGVVFAELNREANFSGVSLEGHTDDTGSAEFNMELSAKRAQAARQYLLSQFDLPAEKIKSLGFGESSPLLENTNAETRSRNRRVEIRMLE